MTEDTIRARVDSDLKKMFEAACKDNDRTASQVLRDFMKSYVAQHGNKQGRLLK